MTLTEKQAARTLSRKYRLALMLANAERRLEALRQEARLFSDDAILNDPSVTDQAWEREIELARIEGQRK